ncbi:hypothetical protein HC341_16580 [Aquisalimonas sp. 2447]|uniref:hypothetical protein n=1 Tax=Aquisalimonas sp. 2447 TaxID=2740807 RepID=UPI0014326E5F|nr:hypothetical protein [Aquisalimonas sp. 2447]QIT56667.1 hypothetical protein HC341_16580 [Aquisalimonas sp. 2447]
MSEKDQDNRKDLDPRSYTDKQVLEEHSREQVERWRREAFEKHRRWMDVMKNDYGKS